MCKGSILKCRFVFTTLVSKEDEGVQGFVVAVVVI